MQTGEEADIFFAFYILVRFAGIGEQQSRRFLLICRKKSARVIHVHHHRRAVPGQTASCLDAGKAYLPQGGIECK